MDIIDFGLKSRTTGVTGANNDSSRSHAILQIDLKDQEGESQGQDEESDGQEGESDGQEGSSSGQENQDGEGERARQAGARAPQAAGEPPPCGGACLSGGLPRQRAGLGAVRCRGDIRAP